MDERYNVAILTSLIKLGLTDEQIHTHLVELGDSIKRGSTYHQDIKSLRKPLLSYDNTKLWGGGAERKCTLCGKKADDNTRGIPLAFTGTWACAGGCK